jgi:hypothetical protein
MAMSTVERVRDFRRERMKLKKSPASANALKGGEVYSLLEMKP